MTAININNEHQKIVLLYRQGSETVYFILYINFYVLILLCCNNVKKTIYIVFKPKRVIFRS